MKRFAKRTTCPSSELLEAYRDGVLCTAALRRVALHIAACDFCCAELRLLSAAPRVPETANDDGATQAPPVPLALRLFADARLEEAALGSSLRRLRAA